MDRPSPANRPENDPGSNPPLEPPDVEGTDKLLELEDERPVDEQVAWIDHTDTDDLGRMTDTEVLEGDLAAGVGDRPDEPEAENLELLVERELRAGETSNPEVAAEEGMTWVPPSDPPVVPDDVPGGASVAAGFGTTAEDEPFDADHHQDVLPDEEEMVARVREALHADSSTSRYADEIAIGTRGGIVALRGVVDDISDTDDLVAVAQMVTGVDEVIDELEVRGV